MKLKLLKNTGGQPGINACEAGKVLTKGNKLEASGLALSSVTEEELIKKYIAVKIKEKPKNKMIKKETLLTKNL